MIPLTAGTTLQVPGQVNSRRMPSVQSAAMVKLLQYEALQFAIVPSGGLKSKTPLVVIDRIGGKEVIPVSNAPSINYNTDGNYRQGISFTNSPDTRLNVNFTVPEEYSMIAVINPTNGITGKVNVVAAHEDRTGDAFMWWVNQDNTDDNLDLHMRHGVSDGIEDLKVVAPSTRSIIHCTYNSEIDVATLGYNNDAVTSDSIVTDHKGDTVLAIGGDDSGTRGFAGIIECLFIFDRALYHPVAGYSINAFREQFIQELASESGITI